MVATVHRIDRAPRQPTAPSPRGALRDESDGEETSAIARKTQHNGMLCALIHFMQHPSASSLALILSSEGSGVAVLALATLFMDRTVQRLSVERTDSRMVAA